MLDDSLQALHQELAVRLRALVKEPDCPAAIIREAREFLKDNGISAKPGSKPAKPVEGIFDGLTPDEYPFAPLNS